MAILWWLMIWLGGVVVVGAAIAVLNALSLAWAQHRQREDGPVHVRPKERRRAF